MFHKRTPNTKHQSKAFNFKMSPFLAIDYCIPLPRKSYALVSGIIKKSLHLSDGSSERASE